MNPTADNPYLFQTIKESVDIVEAARRYGLEPDRNGWCRCPFHNEKTASFHLYRQRFKCFGCGQSGDVIDLASALGGLGPLEAVKELNQVFRLGIDLEAPADTLEAVRAREARRERERYRTWREEALLCLTGYYRRLWRVKLQLEPTDPEQEIPLPWCAAARWLDYVEHHLDLLAYGEEQDIRQAKPVIDALVEKLQRRGRT